MVSTGAVNASPRTAGFPTDFENVFYARFVSTCLRDGKETVSNRDADVASPQSASRQVTRTCARNVSSPPSIGTAASAAASRAMAAIGHGLRPLCNTLLDAGDRPERHARRFRIERPLGERIAHGGAARLVLERLRLVHGERGAGDGVGALGDHAVEQRADLRRGRGCARRARCARNSRRFSARKAASRRSSSGGCE